MDWNGSQSLANGEGRSVLVTGAAGLIGVPVVRDLRKAGFRVIAVDNGSAGTLDRLGEFAADGAVHVARLDIRDGGELTELMAQFRPWGVVHLAAKHFIPECEARPDVALDVNVIGTQRLLDACALFPPSRFVFASTADVYAPGDRPHDENAPTGPRGAYGASKLLCEHLLRDQAYRLDACEVLVARLFNVFGPGDPHPHLIPEVLRQTRGGREVLHLGALDSTRDYVFVEDMAQALTELLESPRSGTFNIGTGVRTSGHDIVRLIAEVTNRELTTHTDPHRLRRVERLHCSAATAKLAEALPWWPRTTVRGGLARIIDLLDEEQRVTEVA